MQLHFGVNDNLRIRFISTIAVVLLAFQAFGAEPVVLAPNEGYCSRLGEVWVVVRFEGTPEVYLDGAKISAPVIKAEGMRHIKVLGIKPGGSELTVRMGDKVKTLQVAGYESSGKGSKAFHRNGWGACSECHTYSPAECRSCHGFSGHKHATYLNCEDCHKGPGVIPVDATLLCSKCHKDISAKNHKNMKHPLNAPQDPRRPGKVFDCVSCHNPHTPACLDRLQKGELREWCRRCHSR